MLDLKFYFLRNDYLILFEMLIVYSIVIFLKSLYIPLIEIFLLLNSSGFSGFD